MTGSISSVVVVVVVRRTCSGHTRSAGPSSNGFIQSHGMTDIQKAMRRLGQDDNGLTKGQSHDQRRIRQEWTDAFENVLGKNIRVRGWKGLNSGDGVCQEPNGSRPHKSILILQEGNGDGDHALQSNFITVPQVS
jgi:hypothetical protein